MVIGSRFVRGGESPGLSLRRLTISRLAGLLTIGLTMVKDSTSGFFAFRKELLREIELKPTSWKVMLEVLIKAKPDRVAEVPITFGERHSGKSKLSKKQVIAYLRHLLLLYKLKHGKRFIQFCLVGATGTVIHFAVLILLTELLGLLYLISAITAVVVASTNNYILNHIWTFKDKAVGNHFVGWIKYNSTSFITDTMYIGLLALFVEIVGLWYVLAAALAIGIIAPIRFVIVSGWIWNKTARPTPVTEAAYDWEAFHSWNPLQRYWKRKIAEKVWDMGENPPKDILDVGSGSSPIICRFPTAIGIDIDQGKLNFIKTKISNELVYMNALNLGFPDESFSLVTFIEVVEHLDNPDKAMSEISRVLRPGGRAIIATPDNSKILWKLVQFLYDRLMIGGYKEKHTALLTRDSLVELAGRHNLELTRLEYVAGCDMVAEFVKSPGPGLPLPAPVYVRDRHFE